MPTASFSYGGSSVRPSHQHKCCGALRLPKYDTVAFPGRAGAGATKAVALVRCDITRGRSLFLELDAKAGQWIAANSDRRWALLLEYWKHLAQRLGRLPKRTEVDPLELPVELLPNIFLVDVVSVADASAPRFRFRLLGTAITARERVRPGQYLEDYRNERASDDMTRQYLECLERRVSVRRTNLAWDHPTKEFITYHVMLLPLSSNGEEVDALLGQAIYEA